MSQVFENKSKKLMLEITSILIDTTSYVPLLTYILNKWNWPDARLVSIWITVMSTGSILPHFLIWQLLLGVFKISNFSFNKSIANIMVSMQTFRNNIHNSPNQKPPKGAM